MTEADYVFQCNVFLYVLGQDIKVNSGPKLCVSARVCVCVCGRKPQCCCVDSWPVNSESGGARLPLASTVTPPCSFP